MKGVTKNIILLLLFLMISIIKGNAYEPQQASTLKNDLEVVLPMVEIVKNEYDNTTEHLEKMNCPEEKKLYLEVYEQEVKRKYLGMLLQLNIRQGKLLLLLIHRELGKTPFDLLKTYLSYRKASFWQYVASLVGANLKQEYSEEKYPSVEKEIQHRNNNYKLFQTGMIIN